jgi:predicted DNA-binding transcriptional regulator AlpA
MQAQLMNETALAARAPSLDDDTLLNSKQVRARVGDVSDMCIWRWVRDDRVQFPKPIKINGRNYWLFGCIRRWQANRTQQKAD